MRQGTVRSARGIAAAVVVCAAMTSPAFAQQPTLTKAPEQKEHVVRKGDTLWDLASFYLSNPYLWPQIYDANKYVVRDPHWIYPTERLFIPGVKADVVEVAVAEPAGPPSHSRFFVAERIDTTSTVISSQVAAISLVQPMEWLAAPWIADSSQLAIQARVFKPYDPRDQNDKLSQNFHPLDKLYISVLGPVAVNTRLLAVRLTKRLEGVGVVVEPLGVLRVDSVGGNTAVAMITSQFSDLKIGDVAIPMPTIPQMPVGDPIPVTGGPTGRIIDFMVEHPLYSNTDYAFVSLGGAQGIAVGDELIAYLPPRQPSDKTPEVLPEQAVAKLQVIRVLNRTATARVTRLNNAGLQAGLAVRVANKAP